MPRRSDVKEQMIEMILHTLLQNDRQMQLDMPATRA
jgi:hypothetical protein